MASIRGHQAAVKFMRNGQQLAVATLKSFSANQKSSFMQSNYVGNPVPEGDQTQEGWEGNAEYEVKDSKIDEFMDALITQNLNGVGVDEVTIVDTEYYPDGRSKSYVYYDVQCKMGKKLGSQTEKVMKTLDWQASGRLAL